MDENTQPTVLGEAQAPSELSRMEEAEQDQLSYNRVPPACPESVRQSRRSQSLQLRLMLACLCCMATVLCKTSFPAGADWLQQWIVGDGQEQVQQAFFSLEDALQNGDGMRRAVEVFCEVLSDDTV